MSFNSIYEIKIEFEENTRNPSNIFYSMGKMIDSMNNLDNVLVESLPCMCEMDIMLESIETGSLRTRLKTILMDIDDEDLKELNWKKIIGRFLVRAKYKIIDIIDKSETIKTKNDIKIVMNSINTIAQEEFSGYNINPNVSTSRMLDALSTISDAMKQLGENEKVIYISSEGSVVFNKNFNLSQEDIELLLTEKNVTSTTKEILVVKKPDYLGKSKWEFYHKEKEKIIYVKLLDDLWLNAFQAGNIDLRPGDSMDVSLETSISLDSEMREVSTSYYLHKVYKIIKNKDDKFQQTTFLE